MHRRPSSISTNVRSTAYQLPDGQINGVENIAKEGIRLPFVDDFARSQYHVMDVVGDGLILRQIVFEKWKLVIHLHSHFQAHEVMYLTATM